MIDSFIFFLIFIFFVGIYFYVNSRKICPKINKWTQITKSLLAGKKKYSDIHLNIVESENTRVVLDCDEYNNVVKAKMFLHLAHFDDVTITKVIIHELAHIINPTVVSHEDHRFISTNKLLLKKASSLFKWFDIEQEIDVTYPCYS